MKKLISLLLVLALCLSFAVTAFAEEFVESPSETPDDCEHPQTEIVNKKDPTCTEPGYTGDEICSECGKVIKKGTPIPKLGHDFEDGVCTRCGAPQGAPETGDAGMMICSALMAMSAMGACVVVARKKFRF